MLISNDDFRKRPEFAYLCEGYHLDPAAPLADQNLPVEEAGSFWTRYGQLRRSCTSLTAGQITARVAAAITAHADGELDVIAVHGAVLVVQDPADGLWMLPVTPPDEQMLGLAMTQAMARTAGDGGAGEPGPRPGSGLS
jgi:hypothetical protein